MHSVPKHGLSTSGWVPLARLLRPQGRRGELLAELLSDLPGIFTAGRELFLAANASASTPNAPPIRLEEHWFPTGKNAGRIVLKLSGCDSISQAEALAGNHLLILASGLPALDPDTFFVGDLIGCTVYDGDHPIGPITDIEFATGPDGRTRLEDAAPLLAVERPSSATPSDEPSEPLLIPFVRAWLDSVDLAAQRIIMHLPEGLVAPPDAPEDDPAS